MLAEADLKAMELSASAAPAQKNNALLALTTADPSSKILPEQEFGPSVLCGDLVVGCQQATIEISASGKKESQLRESLVVPN